MTRTSAKSSQQEATVESHAAKLEAELSAVRQLAATIASIKKIKSQFPSLFDGFKHQLHSAIDDEPTQAEAIPAENRISGQAADPDEPSEEKTGFGMLVAFFRDRNNEPATVRQMVKATGRSPKTIQTIIHSRHKGRFQKVDKRGSNNRAYYHLAEPPVSPK